MRRLGHRRRVCVCVWGGGRGWKREREYKCAVLDTKEEVVYVSINAPSWTKGELVRGFGGGGEREKK